MNLCACESKERRHGKGAGVHATQLSDTLVNESRRIRYMGEGSVAKKSHELVCKRGRGASAWGGCWCACYSAVRYTIFNRFRRISHMGEGSVAKEPHEPVCKRERGAWAWGGCWRACYSAVRCTIVNRSRRIRQLGEGSVAQKTMNLCACVSEEIGHGESAGEHATLLSDVLLSIGLGECPASACVSEERGSDLLMTGTDLLIGSKGTS